MPVPSAECLAFRNIFYTTIIQENIGFLSSECKCYLLRRLCIRRFNTSNSRFCVRRVTHCRAFYKKIFLELIFPGLFSFSCSPSDSRRSFFTSLLCGVIVVGSCLLLRSSTASQSKSSSTIVLLTAFSMKLYS